VRPRRADIPRLLTEAGIPVDADEATLRHELERRGWRVQLEEPLRDDVLRQRGGTGNRYRALVFRVRADQPAAAFRFADQVKQHGTSAEEALRKVLAAVVARHND
jgi:hypothetical protein